MALFTIAAGAVFAAPPAAANTNRVEVVNFSTNLRVDVMWASPNDGQGVFLCPNNASAETGRVAEAMNLHQRQWLGGPRQQFGFRMHYSARS